MASEEIAVNRFGKKFCVRDNKVGVVLYFFLITTSV